MSSEVTFILLCFYSLTWLLLHNCNPCIDYCNAQSALYCMTWHCKIFLTFNSNSRKHVEAYRCLEIYQDLLATSSWHQRSTNSDHPEGIRFRGAVSGHNSPAATGDGLRGLAQRGKLGTRKARCAIHYLHIHMVSEHKLVPS